MNEMGREPDRCQEPLLCRGGGNCWLRLAALLAWLPPAAFFAAGYWPFLLLPAIAVTAWALLAELDPGGRERPGKPQ